MIRIVPYYSAVAKMTLGEARARLRWTQTELERRAGLRQGTVSDIELGRNGRPAYETVMQIVKALQRGGLKTLRKPEDIFPVPETEAKAS